MLRGRPGSATGAPLLVAALTVAAVIFGGGCSGSGENRSNSPPTSIVASTTTGDVGTRRTTTTSMPAKTVVAADLCEAASLTPEGPISDDDLSEISGVVASRRRAEVLWVHNDSGHPNEVWAIDHGGRVRNRFTVTGAESIDWEDIGLGTGPSADRDYLYVGDIGDNSFTPVFGKGLDPRSDSRPVMIYRVPEPDVDAAAANDDPGSMAAAVATDPAAAFAVAYEDGPRDAEALLADPLSGDVFVVSKQWDGAAPGLYRLPAETLAAEVVPDGITTMERVADVAGPGGEPGPGLITGADLSADGTLVALRTYGSVMLWDRDLALTLAETLDQPPACSRKIAEPQGEAVAFGPDSQSLVTISEGTDVPLNWFRVAAD